MYGASGRRILVIGMVLVVAATMWAAAVRIAVLCAAASAKSDEEGPRPAQQQDELFLAAEEGDVSLLKARLLAEPDRVDSRDEQMFSLLHVAACRGDERLARMLLHMGANPDARDMLGDTPLHYAVRNGRVGVARLLVGAGASPGASNVLGKTPRQEASGCEGRRAAVAQVLRGAGAGARQR